MIQFASFKGVRHWKLAVLLYLFTYKRYRNVLRNRFNNASFHSARLRRTHQVRDTILLEAETLPWYQLGPHGALDQVIPVSPTKRSFRVLAALVED